MSVHDIHFLGEIWKIFTWIISLYSAMGLIKE